MAIHTNLIPTLIYALLRTIVSSIIALCGVSFLVGKTLGESYRFILSRCSDAMLARGTLHGEEYVGAGLFLAAVKISLDFAVHSLLSIFSGNDVARTPVFGFWFMEIPATVGELLPLVPYIILALPFCWLGIGLTLARLRDARLPSPWILLFFVPAVNMLLFTILCVIPSASSAETDSSEDATWIPKSRAGIAVSSIALTSALGLVTILVGAGIFKSYGTPLFMGLPFMLGFISSSLYSIATKRTLRECLGISFLCLVAVGILLVALMVEGIICLAVLFPIAALLSSIGALFGYAIQASRPRKREIILSTHLGWLAIFPLVAIPVYLY